MIKPNISKSIFVAPNATIVGDVKLESGTSVWFGAVIRCDGSQVTVGCNTNIQDNCVLHCDNGRSISIGDNVTVGHSAIVHGASVGNNVLVGMHATLMNDCVIGDNCIIGAGALVKEKQVIPAGSLVVGVPAKVIRPLTEENFIAIAASAEHYVSSAKEYAEEFGTGK